MLFLNPDALARGIDKNVNVKEDKIWPFPGNKIILCPSNAHASTAETAELSFKPWTPE